jgi:hypothetical protein
MVAALPYLYWVVPETGGPTLEEVDVYFMQQEGWVISGAKNIRRFVRECGDLAPREEVEYQETNADKDE